MELGNGGATVATHAACSQSPKCYFVLFPDEAVVEQASAGLLAPGSFLFFFFLEFIGDTFVNKII